MKACPPPKLPGMTNLVLTRRRNDHNDTQATNTKVTAENKIPPLRKALPKNNTPVPMNDLSNWLIEFQDVVLQQITGRAYHKHCLRDGSVSTVSAGATGTTS